MWYPGNERTYARLLDPALISLREPGIGEALFGARRKIGFPAVQRAAVPSPLNNVRRPAPSGRVIAPKPVQFRGRIGSQ